MKKKTIEQMFEMMKTLCFNLSIKRDDNKEWYLDLPSVEIREGCILSSATGRGTTPNDAIKETWDILTEVTFPTTINIGGLTSSKQYLWCDALNKFVLADVMSDA